MCWCVGVRWVCKYYVRYVYARSIVWKKCVRLCKSLHKKSNVSMSYVVSRYPMQASCKGYVMQVCTKISNANMWSVVCKYFVKKHWQKNLLKVKSKCYYDLKKKKITSLFLQILKLCFLNTWPAKLWALIFIERMFTLSVSFGCHCLHTITHIQNLNKFRLDLRGLHQGKSNVTDVIYSLA